MNLWSFEMFHKMPTIMLAAAAFAALSATASAETTRHRHHPRVAEQYNFERPPLTVNRRSFLDPGPVVPVGSM